MNSTTTNTKILIVEDDESLGSTLRTFLRDEGYNVDLAPNITEAKTKDYDILPEDVEQEYFVWFW